MEAGMLEVVVEGRLAIRVRKRCGLLVRLERMRYRLLALLARVEREPLEA
jgi:hypothetical protein